MARQKLTVTTIDRDGVAAAAEANGDVAEGHSAPNDDSLVLVVRNNDGVNPHNVTFVTPGTADGLAISDLVVAVPAGETRYFGSFGRHVFGPLVLVDVASAELKLRVFKLE